MKPLIVWTLKAIMMHCSQIFPDFFSFSSGPANSDPHYERVFLLDPQYQNPVALRNKLPELSQSAEASGKRNISSDLQYAGEMAGEFRKMPGF